MIEEDSKHWQQLLGIFVYCDGTAISHFHDMELIQVKISLGIFSREARTKDHCWVPIGFIEKIHEQGGRGRAILEETHHIEAQDAVDPDDNSSGGVRSVDGVGDKADQDLHAMLSVVFEDYKKTIQKRGFLWTQCDGNGEQYDPIYYKTFVPLVRCDIKEADLFAGKFGQRSTTQEICRKCHIPLQEADDHLAEYPLKTVKEIQKLVEKGDIDGLRAMSQTYLQNAFHDIRFSMGNDYGIHGSIPTDMLHTFLLGTFKYI